MKAKLTSRVEFRGILKDILVCLKDDLNRPGLSPLTVEEIHFWLHEITEDDIRVVLADIEMRGGRAPA